MKPSLGDPARLRQLRNTKLYRSLMRTFRVYNRRLVEQLKARGFSDFSPAFPQILSNLDTEGTRIGVLAARAGVTRQAAGQLVTEIERCGYVRREASAADGRATLVRFTVRGKRLLVSVLELIEQIESDFAQVIGPKRYLALQRDLFRIAEAIDNVGALGTDEE